MTVDEKKESCCTPFSRYVTLEVPDGYLVDSEIQETTLKLLYLENLHLNIYIVQGLMKYRILLYTVRMLLLEVPEGDQVDFDIHETSLCWFVLKKLAKTCV